MNRIQTNKVSALRCQELQQLLQITKIADAPVALRAQAVQLHTDPPVLFICKSGWLKTAGRCHNQRLLTFQRCRAGHPQPVIAGFKLNRHGMLV